MSLASGPPRAAVASNISPWIRQARSQVGSRLAVASSAKINRPRPPPVSATGARFSLSRKSATSAECRSVGSRVLSSLITSSRRLEPDRGIVEDRAATRQTGIGARQQIDPDTLLECMIGPQPFDDDHPLLHALKALRMEDQAAAPVADAHLVAIIEPEPRQRLGMDQRRRPALAGEARRRIVW